MDIRSRGSIAMLCKLGLTVSLIAGALGGAMSTTAIAASTREEVRLPVPEPVGSLGTGDTLFWDGELYVERVVGTQAPYGLTNDRGDGGLHGVDTCDRAEPCWAYEIDVTEAAHRLRVTLDVNRRSDCAQLELWAPGVYGDPNATFTTYRLTCAELFPTVYPQLWDLELAVMDPVPGAWVVRVFPFQVENWGFRLRANLEGEPEGDTSVVYPDLRALPPYDFGFSAPINPGAGVVADDQNPPGPLSCTPDEIDESQRETGAAPLRCLRFSSGVFNLGEGLLDLRLMNGGKVIQQFRRGDGSYAGTQPAGTWTSGGTHLHNHLRGLVDFELYKVLDAPTHPVPHSGNLEQVGTGHKFGWNPADQVLWDWSRIDPWVQWEEWGRCQIMDRGMNPEITNCIGVSPGWGDNYLWSRPGSYVDFPLDVNGSGDGDYVVKMIMDNGHNIAESNERNNVSYSWIRVVGSQVTVCERGLGESPWDPHKETHEPFYWSTLGGSTSDGPTGDCSTSGAHNRMGQLSGR